MASTVKTLMTVLIFNLVIGLIITAGHSNYEGTELDYAINEQGEFTNKIDEGFFEESTNDGLLDEAEYGNAYSMGKVITDLLKNGLITLPKLEGTNTIEKIFGMFVWLFRGWLYFLLGLQIFRLIKNKG